MTIHASPHLHLLEKLGPASAAHRFGIIHCQELRSHEDATQQWNQFTEHLMTPAHVTNKSFLPMTPPDNSVWWLNIGDSLSGIFRQVVVSWKRYCYYQTQITTEIITKNCLVDDRQYETYILNVHPPPIPTSNIDGMAQLTFFDGATDSDLHICSCKT